MSRKITPPVTPRIVRDNPRQRLLRLVLLVFAFLLTAWFGYDYGRSSHQRPVQVGEDYVLPEDQALRIGQLERERDALQRQVEELQQSMEQANESLAEAQNRMHSPDLEQGRRSEPDPAATTRIGTRTLVDAPSPLAAPGPSDQLILENLDIEPTESADTFRLRFTVREASNRDERVTGNIWIAVNGTVKGKPRRLSLKALSPADRPYVKMGFDQRQEVEEDLVLPADFVPRNVLIEAKPYGDVYEAVSEKFDWVKYN